MNTKEQWKERCVGCIYLVEEQGQWFCNEMQKFCKDIDTCVEESED